MKELILIRHAKSDWGSEFLQDVDRPLNERGYSDAYFMSKWYLDHKLSPDLVVSSAATRALNTALIFARTLELPSDKFILDHRFYECPAKKMMTQIAEWPDAAERIMLFSHNPGITDLVNLLTDEVFIDNVPTCGIIALQLKIKSWKEIPDQKAKLLYYQFPKDFRNTDS